MELTLCKALEVSIKKWELLYEKPCRLSWISLTMPELTECVCECPLCQIYLEITGYALNIEYKHINTECPLYEEKQDDDDDGDELLCCKDFHNFLEIHEDQDKEAEAKIYALNILNKLKAKLKELETNKTKEIKGV